GARGRAPRRGTARAPGGRARRGAVRVRGVSRARLALCCLVLAGCALLRPRPSGPLVPAELPALEDDLDLASLRAAVERTRPVYSRAGDAAALAAADRLLAILDTTADPEARREAVARTFRVVRFRDPALLTAYHQ